MRRARLRRVGVARERRVDDSFARVFPFQRTRANDTPTTTRAVYRRARAVRDDVEMATDDAMNVLARAGGAREDDGGATRRAGRDARGVGDA